MAVLAAAAVGDQGAKTCTLIMVAWCKDTGTPEQMAAHTVQRGHKEQGWVGPAWLQCNDNLMWQSHPH